MKNTRLLCGLLAMLLFILCLAACTKPDDTTPPTDTGEQETGEPPSPTHDENGYELDSLPGAMDFGNREVRILTWNASPDEFCFTEEIGVGVIVEAQYNQLDRVENRLNIDITFNKIPGLYDDRDAYLQDMESSNLSGDPYDIVSAYSSTGALAATRGLLQNLSHMNYIDFQKPWWPQDLQDSVAIEGNLYFTSGDISPNLIYGLFSIIVNMDRWNDYYGDQYGSTYLYDLVDNKQWYLSTLMELSKGLYVDLDNNGKTDSDRYGIVFANDVSLDAFLQGSGIDIVTKNSSGKLVMSDSFFSERMVNLVSTMSEFYHSEDVRTAEDYSGIFPEGLALFWLTKIVKCQTSLAETSMTYAALPIPLYDETQKGYVTTMNHNFSTFGILSGLNAEETDCSAATLEALASEAYRLVSPAIFEQSFRLRYSADEDVSRMYQYVRDGLKFDMGRLYRLNFNNIPGTMFRNCIIQRKAWYSTVSSNKGQWNRTLGKITDEILALSAK